MNYTAVHKKVKPLGILVGKLVLFGSIGVADAQTSNDFVILKVPPAVPEACDDVHFLEPIYERAHGGAPPVLDADRIKVEVVRNAQNRFSWQLEVWSPKGERVYRETKESVLGADCSGAVAEAAEAAGLAIVGQRLGPLAPNSDYFVTFESEKGFEACENPQLFQWFFDRIRQPRRFPPRFPKRIHLRLSGDLSTKSRVDIDVHASRGAKLEWDKPLVVEEDRPTECSKLLFYAAKKVAGEGMAAPYEPLAEAPTWPGVLPSPLFWAGFGSNLATDLSFKEPMAGGLFVLQFVPHDWIILQASLQQFASRQVLIGPVQFPLNIEKVTTYSYETCLRPPHSWWLCGGMKLLQLTADGGALKYAKQVTVYQTAPTLKLLHALSVSEQLKFEFFVGGEWFPRSAELSIDGRTLWKGTPLGFSGGLIVLTDLTEILIR